jgi:hypothetical protein
MNSYLLRLNVSVKLLVQTHSRLLRKLLQLLLSVVVAAEEGRVTGFHVSLYGGSPHDNVKTPDLIFVTFQNLLKIKYSKCVFQ